MSESFSSCPLLTNELLFSIGYVTEKPELSYSDNYEEFPLQIDSAEADGNNIRGKIRDARCTWYPDTHNLRIYKRCRFTSAYYLFGAAGIAASSATIGVALRWISTRSDERGIIPFGELTKLNSSEEMVLDAFFDKGRLKGSLKIQTVVYLKDHGCPDESEKFFAQQEGTILGVLDQAELYVDGNGSIFPIVTVTDPGKPLWQVYYNEFADPLQDRFDSENVEIRLNDAHSNFEALKIENSMSESPLFVEVLASALLVIVESVKDVLGDDWDNVLKGDSFSNGSIAQAIYYFVTKLQWDVSNPAKLSSSIKAFFDRSNKG